MCRGNGCLAVLSSVPFCAQSNNVTQKGRPRHLQQTILSEVVRFNIVKPAITATVMANVKREQRQSIQMATIFTRHEDSDHINFHRTLT